MADDIVTRDVTDPWKEICELRDEIERLREERDTARAEASMKGYQLDDALDKIERLRAAGDALAKSLAEFHDPFDELRLLAWQEARRG